MGYSIKIVDNVVCENADDCKKKFIKIEDGSVICIHAGVRFPAIKSEAAVARHCAAKSLTFVLDGSFVSSENLQSKIAQGFLTGVAMEDSFSLRNYT